MGPSPLVSIVIPAYKPTFFEAALRSAFAQDYSTIEIVIGDDCPTGAIEDIVERLRPESPWPVHYQRNAEQKGEAANVTQGVARAQGLYIKFLYDDDLLEPTCVRRQVETFEAYPGLAMVTARRRLVDEQGQPLPNTYATRFPFLESTRLNGPDLTSFLGDYPWNIIGEPSSVMCRRSDLLAFGDSIFGLAGQPIDWLGDLAIYVKLLRQGDLAMLDETLSSFRVSRHQFSQGGRDDTSGPRAFHELFRRLVKQLGWVRPQAVNTQVRKAALALGSGDAALLEPYDLGAWMNEVLPGYVQPDFRRWLDTRQLGPVRQARIDTHVQAQGGGPALLVVIKDLGNNGSNLLHSLHSLDRQAPLLANTTVVVMSTRPDAGTGLIEKGLYWVATDPAHYTGHLNQLISELEFDWLITLEAGSRLHADALSVTLLELMGKPACPAIFCDETYRDGAGGQWPLLRGNFNLDQLLSTPVAMAEHWFFQRDALLAMDGFDGSVPEAIELDLILRLVEAGQQGFGHISEPLVVRQPSPLTACEDERVVLLQHLQRRGYSDAQVNESAPRHYLIDYASATPTVAVLVAAQGSLEHLKRCVATVLMLTHYSNYQLVLVETERTPDDVRQWMSTMAQESQGRVVALCSEAPLGLNTALNGAVEALSADYVAFLDAACVIADGQWLGLLVDQAMRPEVGAVGARRIERAERLQDAGLRLGLEGPADTLLLVHQPGPVDYIQVQRNVVALSRTCLVMSRAIFRQVGGFDDTRFTQRWADVDLCLKLHWAGYLNVWTPRAWVALTEPVRQPHDTALDDEQAMYAQWGASLGRDPCLSYLHALRGNGFEFDPDPQVLWRPMAFAGLPVVIGLGQCGAREARIAQPLEALRSAGLVEGGLTPTALGVSEWLRLMPGSVVVPFAPGNDAGLDAARSQIAPCRICDLAAAHDQWLEPAALRQALAGFDKVLVATPGQAARVAGTHPHIEVVPACLPPALWRELPSAKPGAGKVRVGLVCDTPSLLDVPLLAQVMEQFAGTVEWVVYGQLPPALRPWVDEFHPVVAPHRYPRLLAELGLHIALVAVVDTFSTLATAEQQVMEHAACATATIVSRPSAWPAAIVAHSVQGFGDALHAWLNDASRRDAVSQASQAQVMAQGLLEGEQAARWIAAWNGVAV
jgi:GT2 family glycosyltransferase